ncbi:transmembrane protein 117 isoform X3 [Aquarana catesbeiana]|uniref:transmembrane protein 117 isoform X3 n=1 Tax=Aquarana catesbeiana TaxID=8400 RepID=UPI003CC9911C
MNSRMLQKITRMGRNFRYYFQHPWSRIVIAYLVTFFNFLIFAEDPVSHSQTEANVIVVGNCFSFIMTKYPGGAWNFLKVLLWLIAIIVGLVAGKFLFHQRLFGHLLRLKVFREDHGSWMTMFFSTILFLFIFSHIYNICLLMAGNMSPYIITEYMGIRNESFMKVAAVGTWMGDFVTAWMVTDMMLQDSQYPDWGKSARAFWRRGNIRIILFWTVLFSLTSVVVLVITTDWISWDKLNRGFLPSDEVSRAFLASFILVFDLLIVMQDDLSQEALTSGREEEALPSGREEEALPSRREEEAVAGPSRSRTECQVPLLRITTKRPRRMTQTEEESLALIREASQILSIPPNAEEAYGTYMATRLLELEKGQRLLCEGLIFQAYQKGLRGELTATTYLADEATPPPPPPAPSTPPEAQPPRKAAAKRGGKAAEKRAGKAPRKTRK